MIELLTPEVVGAPGRTLVARIVVTNERADATTYQVRVLGGDVEPSRSVTGGAVEPGASIQIDVPIVVPDTLGVGRHVVALEVASDRPRDKPELASVVVDIMSVQRVVLTPKPEVVRGFRSARFQLLVENREPMRVPLRLRSDALDVTARFKPDAFELEPGQLKKVKARFRGPFRWSGEPVQHLVAIEAEGPSRSTSTTVRYVQRSLIGWQVRRFALLTLVLALLFGAGALAWGWWNGRGADDTAAGETTTSVDGSVPGDDAASGGPGDDTDGGAAGDGDASGGSDDATGGGGAGGSGDADAAADQRTTTAFYGAVTTADGSDAVGVTVRARPLSLEERAETPSTPTGFSGTWSAPRIGKIWPARYGAASSGAIGAVRQTETVEPLSTQATDGGVWKLEGIGLRQTWEIEFSLPGYDTQHMVVTPPDDGERVEINPELVASIGEISGRVTSGGAPLGDVEVTATDGTVVITTRTASGTGEYRLTALSTPAEYTLVFATPGFSDAVLQVGLDAGETLGGQDVALLEGLGSISGTVSAASGGVTEPLGGAVVIATLGDREYRTTTLTSGAVGFYNLPGLPVSANEPYTIRVESDRFSTETQSRIVAGAVRNVDFVLTELTGGIAGIVVDESLEGIPAALVTLRRDGLEFGKSTVGTDTVVDGAVPTGSGVVVQGSAAIQQTGAAPSVGSFVFENVPPGQYTVTIEHYLYELRSFSVDIEPGGVRWFPSGERTTAFPDGPPIVMTRLPIEGEISETIQFRSVEVVGGVSTGDSEGQEIFGVTYTIESPQLDAPIVLSPIIGSDGEPGGVRAVELPVGSYRVKATVSSHFTVTDTVVVGIDTDSYTFRMAPKGAVSVLVLDSVTGDPITNEDWNLQLVPVGAGSTQSGAVESGTSTWTSNSSELPAGDWDVNVLQHPTGFRLLPQLLVDTDDPTRVVATEPMRFTIDPTVGGNLNFSLVAEQLPDLTVDLRQPVPAGVGTPPTLPRFALADAAQVDVTITCTDADDPGGTVQLDLIAEDDGAGDGVHRLARGQGRGADLLDADQDGDFGTCTLATSGASALASDDIAAFAVDLAMGSSAPYHRQVAAVLLPNRHTVTATVQWRPDPSQAPEDLTGVRITSVGFVNGYEISSTLADTVPDPQPTYRTSVRTFTPDGSGRITMDRQRAGVAVYTVSSDETNDASFTLTIPPGGGGPLGGETGLTAAVGPLDDPANLLFDYAILHENPLPGAVSGCVAVDSIPTVAPTDVTVVATPSGPNAVDPNPIANDTTEDTSLTCATQLRPGGGTAPQLVTFTIDPASAGYWDIDVTPPAYARLLASPGADLDAPFVLQPGTTVDDLSLRYVLDAQLDLSVAIDTGAGLQAVAATARVERVSDSAVVVADTSVTALDTVLAPITVDDVTPLTPVPYRLVLEGLDAFDVTSATITVDGGTPVVGDASSIAFAVGAGEIRDIEVVVQPLGSISGTIENQLWPDVADTARDESELGSIVDLASARVYYCRVTTAGPPGSPTIDPSSPSSPDLSGTNPACGSTTVVDDAGTYRYQFSGLAGWYRIWVVHPQYQEIDTPAPTSADIADGTRDAFEMQNDTDRVIADPFVVEPLRGSVTLDVLERVTVGLDPPAYADGALVSIRRTGAIPHDGTLILATADPLYSDALSATPDSNPSQDEWTQIDPTGARRNVAVAGATISLTGLRPGSYLIDVVDPTDQHYPVTIQVTLPQSADVTVRSVVVTAYAPRRGANIQATVHVVNSTWAGSGYPIAETASLPTGLTATHTFLAPDAVVTEGTTASSLVANQAVVTADVTPTPGTPPATGADPTSATIDVANVAAGGHVISLGTLPDGYTLYSAPSEITVTEADVGSSATVTADIVIVADDVDVTIDPRDDVDSATNFVTIPADITLDAASLTYEWPGGSELVVAQSTTRDGTGKIVFTGIPARPRFGTPTTTAGYTASVDTPLHAAGSTSVNVDPQAPGVTGDSSSGFALEVGVELTADQGEMTLSAYRVDAAGPPEVTGALPGGTVVSIWNGGSQLADGVDYTGSYDSTAREYAFLTGTAGSVQVRAEVTSVEVPGPYVSDAVDVTVVLGRRSTVGTGLALLKRPTLIVNISSPPANVAVVATPTGGGTAVTGFSSGSNSWTLQLEPDTQYDVTVDGGTPLGQDYFQDTYATPVAGYPVGGGDSIAASLPTRSIAVSLARNGDLSPTLAATVTASISGGDVASGTANFAADASTSSITLPVTGLIPVTGTIDVTVSAAGYRTRTVTSSTSATRSSPQESLSVSIYPLATVSGTVTGYDDGGGGGATDPTGLTVTATRQGSSPLEQYTATVQGDGSYAFGNIFDVGTWDLFVGDTGVGADGGTFTITSNDVSSTDFTKVSTSRLTADLTLAPRTLSWNIIVKDSGGSTVTATLTGDVATEAGTSYPLTISSSGKFTRSYTVDLLTTDGTGTTTVLDDPATITITRTVTISDAPVATGTVDTTPDNASQVDQISLVRSTCAAINMTTSPASVLGYIGNIETTSATFSTAKDPPAHQITEPDVYCVIAYDSLGGGSFEGKAWVQLTYTEGTDGVPVLTPASSSLAWSITLT